MILFDGSCASGNEPAEGDEVSRGGEKKEHCEKSAPVSQHHARGPLKNAD